MALYADSAEKERTILKIRHALIVSKGNATEAAAMLKMYRADLWAYTEDYPEIFRDLLQKGTPNPKLLDNLSWQAERDSMTRALEITNNNKQAAAKVLGMNRTTLHERLQKLGIDDGSDS